jgi:hypothetical protein
VVQDRVLNEATRVLSLQLGLTIDTLIRDMMVSTASTILCSNGLNGRQNLGIAVLKSALIDSESLQGDEAQAVERLAA